MRTVSIFKNGNNRAIRLPRDLDFEGVSELERADPGFMAEREIWSAMKDALSYEENLDARH